MTKTTALLTLSLLAAATLPASPAQARLSRPLISAVAAAACIGAACLRDSGDAAKPDGEAARTEFVEEPIGEAGPAPTATTEENARLIAVRIESDPGTWETHEEFRGPRALAPWLATLTRKQAERALAQLFLRNLAVIETDMSVRAMPELEFRPSLDRYGDAMLEIRTRPTTKNEARWDWVWSAVPHHEARFPVGVVLSELRAKLGHFLSSDRDNQERAAELLDPEWNSRVVRSAQVDSPRPTLAQRARDAEVARQFRSANSRADRLFKPAR
jgi:hypothetical protein